MGDTTQASASPEAEAAKGDQSVKTQTPPTAEANAAAQAANVTDEQKKANDRLAEIGRERKAEKERIKTLESELQAERTEKERLWFTHPDTPEEKKDEYRRGREQAVKDAPKMEQANNRIALAEAIADEENPVVRKALRSLKTQADASKRYPDASIIAALRASLAPDEGDSEASQHQPGEENLPNVSSSRGTRAAAGPSIDDQIKEVETALKTRINPKGYSYGDLLGLRQASQMEKAAAARG